jgi:hypothetical protein
VRAERYTASKIVISFHLLAPQAALRFAFHQNQLQRLALIRSAVDGSGLATWCGYIDSARTPSSQTPKLGKRQRSFGGEPLQQLPAFMILETSIGSLPLQQLTDRARDLGYPQGGKLRCDLAHQLQFVAAKRAPAKGQGVRHGKGIEGGFSAV